MNNIEQKIIKPKLGLLELAKQLGSVSQACKTMGYSRIAFTVLNACMRMGARKRYARSVGASRLSRTVCQSMSKKPWLIWR